MPSTATSAASAVLSDAFLAAAVYALVEWIIKPLIVNYWLHQDNPYQDNATRAAGFVVAYALTLINTAVQQPLTWSLAWSLLPTAAGIYASSALVYHISTPNPATVTPNPAPVVAPVAPSQPPAPALGAAGEIEQIAGALTALAAAIASGRIAAPATNAVVTPAPAPSTPIKPATPVAPAAPTWDALPAGDVDPLTRALGTSVNPTPGAASSAPG